MRDEERARGEGGSYFGGNRDSKDYVPSLFTFYYLFTSYIRTFLGRMKVKDFLPLSRLSRNSAASIRTAILIFTQKSFLLYLFTLKEFSDFFFLILFFVVEASAKISRFSLQLVDFFAKKFSFIFLCNKYLFAKFSK